ncbi:hypothetical protein [Nocardia sp. NPDC051833]|uniref:hypothetical protein n=1 Tax=Nocardia sp. NPDC051833 TaxID=3155674 RepID=UPI0034480023
MDELIIAAGSALVTALTTQTWTQARDAIVGLWRHGDPEEAEEVGRDLERQRPGLEAAQAAGDTTIEAVLAESWQHRLRRLLQHDPELAVELRRVLDENLRPAAPGAVPVEDHSVTLNAEVSGGISIQAGRDAHLSGPPPLP